MELLVVLVIIYMVVRTLGQNAKANKQRQEARKSEAESYRPRPGVMPGSASPQGDDKPKGIRGLLDSLENLGIPTGPASARPPRQASSIPVPPPEASSEGMSQWSNHPPRGQAAPQIAMRLSDIGEAGGEGCLEEPEDCEAPHARLQASPPRSYAPQPVEEGDLVPALHDMPELVKGVIYAEILTRPKYRRRLRP